MALQIRLVQITPAKSLKLDFGTSWTGITASDKIAERHRELLKHATELIGSPERAKVWLTTPKIALGGKISVECARTKKGAGVIFNVMGSLDHGNHL